MTSYDWEHISEGLGPFYFYGLSRPDDPLYEERLRRFVGFYLNEDPGAPNYDSERRLIRSLFNGSRGPKMTPATVEDWDGPVGADVDPTSARRPRFVDAVNIVGDHPLNLNVTMLHLHAYMVTGDEKYRDWVLEYVDAWRERIEESCGNIPSNVGLDGTIGGQWDGTWYSGVFGWDSPDGGKRNYTLRGPPEAFGAALLLTLPEIRATRPSSAASSTNSSPSAGSRTAGPSSRVTTGKTAGTGTHPSGPLLPGRSATT